ncbi:MAG: acetate--CoA ligase family protein [Desulfocucumaceae bacterium]
MNPEEIFRRAREDGRSLLLEIESKEILESHGIATTGCFKVESPEEAREKAEKMGFPVVMKISSAKISHKSDVGGVALNLLSGEEVAGAYRRLISTAGRDDPGAGVVLQKMARPGVELIVGVTRDNHFGPVIMLGLGGIFTEVLKDFTYRMLPVSPWDARDMICSLQGYSLLTGYRGQEPADLDALQGLICRVSDLVAAFPDIMEMDLNPVAVYPDGYLVLDARMVLK